MKYSSQTSYMLMSLANGTSRTLMNPLFVNGRYINQWEAPINKWLVLAYKRDQFSSSSFLGYFKDFRLLLGAK